MTIQIVSTGNCPGRKLTLDVCGLDAIFRMQGDWTIFASMVDPEYLAPIAAEHVRCVHRLQFKFHDIIEECPELISPSSEVVEQWIAAILNAVQDGDVSILVHCHLGISRSVAAAAIAIAALVPDMLPQIPAYLAKLSPRPWPNRRMLAFADRYLKLEGKLLESGMHTRLQTARRFPEWTKVLAASPRAPEVEELRPFLPWS